MNDFLLDKNGREILVGDVVKVFHFVGARRKRYYMYKWVKERVMLGKEKQYPAFKMSHLTAGNVDDSYYEMLNGRKLEGVEIIQGYGKEDRGVGEPVICFDQRPKREPAPDAPKPARWVISGEEL